VAYATQNEDFIYLLDAKGASSIDKGNETKKTLFKKSWETDGGIGVFGSNLYVLDKAAGISKFVRDRLQTELNLRAAAVAARAAFAAGAPSFCVSHWCDSRQCIGKHGD
jgi:hypothetical protein